MQLRNCKFHNTVVRRGTNCPPISRGNRLNRMFLDLKRAALTSAVALFPCALTLAMSCREKFSNLFLSSLVCASGILGLAILLNIGRLPIDFQSCSPFLIGVFPASFSIDALSGLFLGLLSTILVVVGLFSPGYLGHLQGKMHFGAYWTAFFLFVISMACVVLSADAITFIVSWEIMSLASAALVASDHTHQRVQKAAFIYLGATRVATAFLAVGFIWMHAICGNWQFSTWSFSTANTYVPAFFILIAFCIKAGIWPFHIWLPYAHPAAPATVSALMSGFMIKIAIYGMIRMFVCGSLNCELLANLVFALGTISAFWGVLFALVQNDLKRLLAYSSIENVGLILMAIALSLKARMANLPEIATLAFTAALFHCINHGLIKSLLFISAGSVDAQAHTLDFRKLGGLAKRTPWTAACFFIGGFAICSLPPFNGFASKWLIYQSLFKSTWLTTSYFERGTAFVGLCILSVVGGLAIASFAKAMGVSFLGNPRSKHAAEAKEADYSMIAAQILLAGFCIGLGIFADKVLACLLQIVRQISGTQASANAVNITSIFPMPLEIVALLLISFSAMIYILFLKTSATKKYISWDCGFGPLSTRTQVNSDSFAQPMARIFRPLLRYQTEVNFDGKDIRHFPEHVSVETKMVSILETRIYLPTLDKIRALSKYLVRLQAGSIHLYLFYLCLTLILLLITGTSL